MSNLDDKLREIYHDPKDAATFIARIKQAFAAERYRSPEELSINEGAAKAFMDKFGTDSSVMTGQEWYDRFENEFKAMTEGIHRTYLDEFGTSDILEAAKRAAGVSDE